MNSNPFRTLAAVALAVLGMTVLPAQMARGQEPPAFAAVDKDKNGAITAEEAVVVPGLAARLTQLDENADSRLSPEEYATLVAEEKEPGPPKEPSMR
jgi:hypothetical protein